MDAEEEKPKAFKVNDRRRFSSEGELKAEHRADSAQSGHSTSASPGDAAAPPPPPPPDTASGFTSVNKPAGTGPPMGEMSFATFMVGLSTQALVHLGEMPDPQSGRPIEDLLAAEQVIDLIAMLQDKTRGNLDEGETQLVQSILFELRMKYVERARHGQH
jgi:Domain of unknown function (DUF1844)